MATMTVLAPAKINLSLDVTGKRADGYHLLSTVMQSISMYDRVTVSLDHQQQGIILACGRAPIPADSRNTAWRAAALFCEATGLSDGIRIDIEKKIPTAAGLAGGSSDAAAVLFALNRLLPGRISHEQLFSLAAQIGADVPFCLAGGTVLCEGIGEILTPLVPWPELPVLLIKPAFGMSTPWVFSRFRMDASGRRPDQLAVLQAIAERDINLLAASTANVLESVSLAARPELAEIKNMLLAAGAAMALMSGSGPSVFGLFAHADDCLFARDWLTARLPADTIVIATQSTAAGLVTA